VWILRYNGAELDDGHNWLTSYTEADLDKFVNWELVNAADVVLWYGAHFTHEPHEPGEGEEAGHRVGPDLVPVNLVGGWLVRIGDRGPGQGAGPTRSIFDCFGGADPSGSSYLGPHLSAEPARVGYRGVQGRGSYEHPSLSLKGKRQRVRSAR
jgi:hypothetical protein